MGFAADEMAAVNAGFSHILRLRLDQQLADIAADTGDRYSLDLSHLHSIDKAILRESLKQARRLQLRLKLNYAL